VVIAIDGPAGTGKSSVADYLAKKLNYTYINSGNLYRAITLACTERGVDTKSESAVLALAKGLSINYSGDSVFVDGADVTDRLHTALIDKLCSPLSAFVPVRGLVNDLIKSTAQSQNIIVEGRDMTTVVFPPADHRFFLDADIDVRAERRFIQQGEGQRQSQAEIKAAIAERDAGDKAKEVGSLRLAEGVTYIDTSHLTLTEVCVIIYDKLFKRNI
jgi:cytidylate kinase